MKKLLLVALATMLSTNVMASEPCWLTVNGYTFDSNKITSMVNYGSSVTVMFDTDYRNINVANAVQGYKLINNIVDKNRQCWAKRTK